MTPEDLAFVVARHGRRWVYLTSDDNPDTLSREAYRALAVRLARGSDGNPVPSPEPPPARPGVPDVKRSGKNCWFKYKTEACGCSGSKCFLKSRTVSIYHCSACEWSKDMKLNG